MQVVVTVQLDAEKTADPSPYERVWFVEEEVRDAVKLLSEILSADGSYAVARTQVRAACSHLSKALGEIDVIREELRDAADPDGAAAAEQAAEERLGFYVQTTGGGLLEAARPRRGLMADR